MIIIFLVIYLNQAKIKQEAYEYRTGQFIITQGEYLHNEIFQAHDPINNKYTTPDNLNKILFQSSYKFDQIIDVQKRLQPLSTIQSQIWVFGKMNDSYSLAELSTEYTNNKIINQIYEILNPSVQCFTFNFALYEQVVFDCTDFQNDFFLVIDIKTSNQYKVYYQKYISQIRKLHFFQDLHIILIQNDDKLYFIRQNQRSRKYFVFYKFKLEDSQLFISQKSEGENLSILFKTFRLQFQARNFMNQYEINYILNLTRTSDNFAFKVNDDYYYVKNYCLISSSYEPFLQLEGQVYNFVQDEDILVIQTINFIYIITIEYNQKRIQELNHTFSNDTILINSKKKEIYVLNSTRLFVYYYQFNTFEIIQFNRSIIIEKNKSSSILILSEQMENSYIHINKYFLFRDAENPNHVVNQFFLFSGGQIDVTFEQIDFLKIDAQYLQLLSQFECNKLYLINENQNVVNKQSLFCQQDQIFYIIECNHVNNCVSQNDSITISHNPHMFSKVGNYIQFSVSESSFLIQAIVGEDKEQIIYQFNQQLTLINFEFGQLIFINHLQRQIEIKNLNNLATYQQIIYIYPRMIRCGEHQSKLLVIENKIATLFLRELLYYQMIQTFDLCDDFLDFIIIDIYLVQICRTKILKYIQITDFVFQLSGYLTLYGETFNLNSQILDSFDKFFYIVQENEISIFNIQLPLKQAYVKKLVLEQFDQVIATNNYLLIRRQSKVYCYKNQLQLEIKYDEDKFEYNQLVYLNVCAQNYYDKKCLKQKFQIKQTNKKIFVKQKRVKVYLNDINQKITINQYFSGSVNQVISNKFNFESRQLAYSYDKTNDPRSLYYLAFSQQYIKFHGSQNITIYDITRNKSMELNTNLNTKDIIKINNYLLLFGSMSQTETYDCTEFPNCQKVCSFQRVFNIFDLMNVQNDLIIIQLSSEIVVYKFDICSFRIINTFKMARSYQAYHLYDDKVQILVYIDFSDFIHYFYNGIEYVYQIEDIFKDYEQIYSFWHINRVKLIENTNIVIFITGMGSFFVQFSQTQDPEILSQLVPYKNSFQHFFSIQIQEETIQIIYQIDYHLIVYNFKVTQIFQQKYIDYRYIQLDFGHSLLSSFGVLFIFNDHIYLTNSTSQQIQVFQVPFYYNLIIDENITENTEIQITLSNSDDKETFIIELIVDDEYIKLKYVLGTVIIVLVSLFCIKRQLYLRKIAIKV